MNYIFQMMENRKKISKHRYVVCLPLLPNKSKTDMIWVGVKKLSKKYNIPYMLMAQYFHGNIIDVTVNHKIKRHSDILKISIIVKE